MAEGCGVKKDLESLSHDHHHESILHIRLNYIDYIQTKHHLYENPSLSVVHIYIYVSRHTHIELYYTYKSITNKNKHLYMIYV